MHSTYQRQKSASFRLDAKTIHIQRFKLIHQHAVLPCNLPHSQVFLDNFFHEVPMMQFTNPWSDDKSGIKKNHCWIYRSYLHFRIEQHLNTFILRLAASLIGSSPPLAAGYLTKKPLANMIQEKPNMRYGKWGQQRGRRAVLCVGFKDWWQTWSQNGWPPWCLEAVGQLGASSGCASTVILVLNGRCTWIQQLDLTSTNVELPKID